MKKTSVEKGTAVDKKCKSFLQGKSSLQLGKHHKVVRNHIKATYRGSCPSEAHVYKKDSVKKMTYRK